MVALEPKEYPSQPEPSSSEHPPTKSSREAIEEIMTKYGLKWGSHPPIVIAKPIPASSGQESIESEKLRREREEEELQNIIAQIDQNVHEAEIAKLQKESEERQKERERKKRHKL